MLLHQHLFDIGQLIQARRGFVREARRLPPGTERNQKRQIARSLKRLIGLLPADIQQEHLLRKAFEANEAVKMNEQLPIPAAAGVRLMPSAPARFY
jgi:hypothetical protein